MTVAQLRRQYHDLTVTAQRVGFEGCFESECQRVIGRKDLTLMEKVEAARVIVWAMESESLYLDAPTKMYAEWPSMPPP